MEEKEEGRRGQEWGGKGKGKDEKERKEKDYVNIFELKNLKSFGGKLRRCIAKA